MNIKLLIILSIVLITLDFVWLSYFSKIIGPMIANIQNSPLKLNYIGAILAYIIMIIGYYFLVYENEVPNYFKAGILGLVMFGVYDFTNYATFNKWDIKILSMDISWGIVLSLLTVFITDKIYKLV